MVMDRLFLWIFTVAVLVGTVGIILQVQGSSSTQSTTNGYGIQMVQIQYLLQLFWWEQQASSSRQGSLSTQSTTYSKVMEYIQYNPHCSCSGGNSRHHPPGRGHWVLSVQLKEYVQYSFFWWELSASSFRYCIGVIEYLKFNQTAEAAVPGLSPAGSLCNNV